MYLDGFFLTYREKNGIDSISMAFEKTMNDQILFLICSKDADDHSLFDSKTELYHLSWHLLHPIDAENNAQYFKMFLSVNKKTFYFDVYFRYKNGEKVRVDDTSITSENIEFWYVTPQPYFDQTNINQILQIKHKVDFPRISKKSLHYDLEIDSFYPGAFYLKIKLEDEGMQQQAIVDYLDHLLTEHNEKMGEKKGFVHDFGFDKWENNILSYYIDLGSAPIKTIVTILNGINQFETIGVVRIC